MSIPIRVYSDVEFGAGSLTLKRNVTITGGDITLSDKTITAQNLTAISTLTSSEVKASNTVNTNAIMPYSGTQIKIGQSSSNNTTMHVYGDVTASKVVATTYEASYIRPVHHDGAVRLELNCTPTTLINANSQYVDLSVGATGKYVAGIPDLFISCAYSNAAKSDFIKFYLQSATYAGYSIIGVAGINASDGNGNSVGDTIYFTSVIHSSTDSPLTRPAFSLPINPASKTTQVSLRLYNVMVYPNASISLVGDSGKLALYRTLIDSHGITTNSIYSDTAKISYLLYSSLEAVSDKR